MIEQTQKKREDGITISIKNVDKKAVSQLEDRLEALRKRNKEIRDNMANLKTTQSFTANVKNNFLIKDKIQDFLYENDVLERHLRSESFKELDELIICNQHIMETLSIEKNSLNMVLDDLEREEEYSSRFINLIES